ncbi:MAG: hypothetical protein LUE26_09305 [Alistipes sp.]|nr:hypothetical protein [Alistipes sp.]
MNTEKTIEITCEELEQNLDYYLEKVQSGIEVVFEYEGKLFSIKRDNYRSGHL